VARMMWLVVVAGASRGRTRPPLLSFDGMHWREGATVFLAPCTGSPPPCAGGVSARCVRASQTTRSGRGVSLSTLVGDVSSLLGPTTPHVAEAMQIHILLPFPLLSSPHPSSSFN
jgi:hypothetical protein